METLINPITGVNQRSNKVWTSIEACFAAEGVIEPTRNEYFEAWAHLIATGQCWQLQGWYGRTAENLINLGFINRQGQIDWFLVDLIQND